ncbi:hypothetical protein TNCV_5020771 [Trichonephila clavipes]|nr:hypothetical protein TNCV_5020771 [Trichonephila clavipes]
MYAAWYIEILTRFMKRLRELRPQYTQQGSLFLAQDNSRPHRANNVEQFLAKKEVVRVKHPPFSTDLNPSEFFLSPRLKLTLKRKSFDDISDIQRNLTRLLNSISKEDFLQNFQDTYSRCQLCIVMGAERDYFEGQIECPNTTSSLVAPFVSAELDPRPAHRVLARKLILSSR